MENGSPLHLAILAGVALLMLWAWRRGKGQESGAAAQAFPPASEQSLDELLAAGRKIEAIKQYREKSGAGLREAKKAVEARAAQLGL